VVNIGEKPTGVLGGEGALVVNELAAKIGLVDFAAQGVAIIRSEFVAVVEGGGIDGEELVGIENGEVGIFARGDGAFLREVDKFCGESG